MRPDGPCVCRPEPHCSTCGPPWSTTVGSRSCASSPSRGTPVCSPWYGWRSPRRACARPGSLYDAIWRRHSSRLPFTADPVPGQLLAELGDAARAEGAELHLPTPDEVMHLLSLTAEAEWRTAGDALWSEDRGPQIPQREGMVHGAPPPAPDPHEVRAHQPGRDITGSGPGRRPSALSFEPRPQLLLLSTAHDTRANWLRSGQALQRILLTVTHHGLRASLLQQALNWPDLRELMRAPGTGSGYPQMLVRVGYGPDGPAVTRRAAVGLATDGAASR
jgi:hypothetical protein